VKDEWEQQLRGLGQEVKLAKEKEKEAEQISKLCRKQEKEFFEKSVLPVCGRFAKAAGWYCPFRKEEGLGDSSIWLSPKLAGLLAGPDRHSASIHIVVKISDPIAKKGHLDIKGGNFVYYEYEVPISLESVDELDLTIIQQAKTIKGIHHGTKRIKKRAIIYKESIPIEDFAEEKLKDSLLNCFKKVLSPCLIIRKSISEEYTLVDPSTGLEEKLH